MQAGELTLCSSSGAGDPGSSKRLLLGLRAAYFFNNGLAPTFPENDGALSCEKDVYLNEQIWWTDYEEDTALLWILNSSLVTLVSLFVKRAKCNDPDYGTMVLFFL